MTMTVLEMAKKYKWAHVTVSLNFGNKHCGHFTAEGLTNIVESQFTTVWVGTLALNKDTVVYVREEIGTDGAKVGVHRCHQPELAA